MSNADNEATYHKHTTLENQVCSLKTLTVEIISHIKIFLAVRNTGLQIVVIKSEY